MQHDIAIAGGHGKIARRLARILSSREDWVRALIRNPDHAKDCLSDGSLPVILDLEHADVDVVAQAINGCDAVVFAAGAGPGSGPERKWSMDHGGAVKLMDACAQVGIDRYVIVSSIGAENPPDDTDTFSVYLQAKAAADRDLERSDLRWTIVRPGSLTDDPGNGHVRIDVEPHRAEVPRDDVAAVLDAVLHEPRTHHRIFYVNAGDEPLADALIAALAAPPSVPIPEP
jgi:nucleoside-diphosphate-sugar epimerase